MLFKVFDMTKLYRATAIAVAAVANWQRSFFSSRHQKKDRLADLHYVCVSC